MSTDIVRSRMCRWSADSVTRVCHQSRAIGKVELRPHGRRNEPAMIEEPDMIFGTLHAFLTRVSILSMNKSLILSWKGFFDISESTYSDIGMGAVCSISKAFG
jgi:hypothetical protein